MRSPSSAPSRADEPSDVSNLLSEIGLRLAKALAAGVLGVLVYILLTGPLGVPASAELALLSWLSAAAFILLVETSPL